MGKRGRGRGAGGLGHAQRHVGPSIYSPFPIGLDSFYFIDFSTWSNKEPEIRFLQVEAFLAGDEIHDLDSVHKCHTH